MNMSTPYNIIGFEEVSLAIHMINNEWFCFDIPLVLDSVLDEIFLQTTLGV